MALDLKTASLLGALLVLSCIMKVQCNAPRPAASQAPCSWDPCPIEDEGMEEPEDDIVCRRSVLGDTLCKPCSCYSNC